MKKRKFVVFAALLFALFVASCGSSQNANGGQNSTGNSGSSDSGRWTPPHI